VKVRLASTGPSHRHVSRRVIASRAGA